MNEQTMDFLERKAYYEEHPIALIVGCGYMGMGCARNLGLRNPLFLIDISKDRLEECIALLRQEGYNVAGQTCDISDAVQIKALGETLAKGPGIKVLAHVAAIGGANAEWRKIMDVDLTGAHLVARMAAPLMVRGGVAILISSTGAYQCPADDRIDALIDDPFQPEFLEKLVDVFGREPDHLEAYFMAKQGVNRLANRLAVEWGAREVRAVSVSPGLIDTTMGRTSGKSLPVDDGKGVVRLGPRSEIAAKLVPLGRQGTVLEISPVIAFLASDAASFINGIDVPVDGGSTALRRYHKLISR